MPGGWQSWPAQELVAVASNDAVTVAGGEGEESVLKSATRSYRFYMRLLEEDSARARLVYSQVEIRVVDGPEYDTHPRQVGDRTERVQAISKS